MGIKDDDDNNDGLDRGFSVFDDISVQCFVSIERAATGNFVGYITRWTGIIYEDRYNNG